MARQETPAVVMKPTDMRRKFMSKADVLELDRKEAEKAAFLRQKEAEFDKGIPEVKKSKAS